MSPLQSCVSGGVGFCLPAWCVACAAAFLLHRPLVAAEECEPAWQPVFGAAAAGFGAPGSMYGDPDLSVFALAEFDDHSGHGPRIYAAGKFSLANGAPAEGIAVWDGATWQPLPGTPAGYVRTLCVHDDGSGPALYAAGHFSVIGGVPANGLARWDGSEWTSLLDTYAGKIHALASFNDSDGPALYVGGEFTVIGGQVARNVAKWSGGRWAALGQGLDQRVFALHVHDDGTGPAIFAGGAFEKSGTITVNRIAKWTGSAWQPLDSGMWNGQVNALCSYRDGTGGPSTLVAAGYFLGAGPYESRWVAMWRAGAWQPMPPGLNFPSDGNGASSLAALPSESAEGGAPDTLIVTGSGGLFQGSPLNGLARWTGSGWAPLGAGVSYQAWSALWTTLLDGRLALLVGGRFTTAGGVPARNIARWNGNAWQPINANLNGTVRSAVYFDDGVGDGPLLYVCGSFTSAGGAPATGLARWRNSEWEPFVGFDGSIDCLEVFDDGMGSGQRLIAAGSFSLAGGVPAQKIAAWDGVAWHPLGNGIAGGGQVHALSAVQTGDPTGRPCLYVAGSFISPSLGVARWSGGAWSPLATISGTVNALAVHDDGTGPALYAGGVFWAAGNTVLNHVARWTGTNWQPLGEGTNGTVLSLASFPDPIAGRRVLCAGGSFTTAGGTSARGVAAWDGASWSPLGLGLDASSDPQGAAGSAQALAVWRTGGASSPASLVVGGQFAAAGGSLASNIALWDGARWRSDLGGVSGFLPYSQTAVLALAVAPDQRLMIGGSFALSPAGDGCMAVLNPCVSSRIPADLNADGLVDGTDLGILLDAWGPCTGGREVPCPADLDQSGVVDGTDLGLLLGSWSR